MIKAIIVEDQPPAQRILQKYINDIGSVELKATFSNAIDAMHFLQSNTVDLMFLDIHLPKMSGIDFLKSSAQLPKVILTTAFADYALESYEYEVVDYLLKPFSFTRFVQAVQKVNTAPEIPTAPSSSTPVEVPQSIVIKSGNDMLKVLVADILYIQSDADYTEVFTSTGKILSNKTLKNWMTTLDPSAFCQVHKSTIVGLWHIDKVAGNMAYIGKVGISIGRVYKEAFLERWEVN